MQENVGDDDSKARLVAGVLLVLLGAVGYTGMVNLAYVLPQELTSVLLTIVGLVLVATGYTRKCMLYNLLGKDTRE